MGTFSTSETASLLYKKFLGSISTLETTPYFQEQIRPARPSVLQSQIYAEAVASVAPADLASATLDDNGATLTGSAAGKTSSTSTMVRKYVKLSLMEVVGSNGRAFEAPDDATYGRVLQDCISFNYDPLGSYLPVLYKSDGTTVIPFGSGDWVLDCEGGVITFYAIENITGVSAATPPKITFFRYVGAKGAATASQTITSIEDSAVNFNKQIQFNGGSTAPDMAAIILDNRNLANLSTTTPCMAFQVGATVDGAWRVAVTGGGGDATQTSLTFETYQGGVWVTKASFMP